MATGNRKLRGGKGRTLEASKVQRKTTRHPGSKKRRVGRPSWGYALQAGIVLAALEEKGESQASLARSLDTSSATVSRWISGERRISQNYLNELSRCLGIPMAKLAK